MLLLDRKTREMLSAPTEEKVIQRQSYYLRKEVDIDNIN